MIPAASAVDPELFDRLCARARTADRRCDPAWGAGSVPDAMAVASPAAPVDRPVLDVLVVEDEPLIRFLIRDLLEGAGFRVEEAADADRALALLAAGGARRRVLVTDLNLGSGPDGAALAGEARRRDPALPVLYVTGNPDCVPRPPQAWPRERVLGKPFDCSELVDSVRWLAASLDGTASA